MRFSRFDASSNIDAHDVPAGICDSTVTAAGNPGPPLLSFSDLPHEVSRMARAVTPAASQSVLLNGLLSGEMSVFVLQSVRIVS